MPDDPVHAVLGRVARWKLAFLAAGLATLHFPLAESELAQPRVQTGRHAGILVGILLTAAMSVGAVWKARHPDPPTSRVEAFRAWISHLGGDLIGLFIWGVSQMAAGRLLHLTWAGGVNVAAWAAVLAAGAAVSPLLVSRASRDHSGMRR